MSKNQKGLPRLLGEAGVAPLILVAVVGLLAFLSVSLSADFNNKLFGNLYPKPPSQAAQPEPEFAKDRVIVQFNKGVSDQVKDNARLRARSTKKELIKVLPQGDLELDTVAQNSSVEATIELLSKDPNVTFVEPDFKYTHQETSNDPYFLNGSLWGMESDSISPANPYGSQASKAWAGGYVGNNTVYVGVIDEGVQFTHPDLAANIWTNPYDSVDGIDNDGNGYIDDTHGWDFFHGDNSIFDSADGDDHGTHVSGTIGGVGGNGVGVAGVNWKVTIINTKFLGPSGGSTSDAIKALDYLTDLKKKHGLNIVATSNSWGGGGYSQSLYDAIERAKSVNILFVAAAGNNGTDNDTTPFYPADYPNDNVIAVAASNNDGTIASFSNYGATTVDLGAPGVTIYSTIPTDAYGAKSGTSMATPHVSGASALYAATHPSATFLQIKNAILSSATPTTALQGKTVTGGRLNVAAMLGLVSLPSPSPTASPTSTPSLSPSPSASSSASPSALPSPSPSPSPSLPPTPPPLSDTTPPTVTITSPVNGAILAKTAQFTIIADASDNIGVAKVEFYIDGGLKCTDTSAPYACTSRIGGKLGTGHTITAKAYDTSNNSSSNTITVTTR